VVEPARDDVYAAALERAAGHARAWLASLRDRPVPPRLSADELAEALGGPLPDGPSDAAEVVDSLAELVEPGLMAMPSGRFFGWVIGGALPAALAADWLTSAWDQNSGMRYATPGTVAAEEAAAGWLLDLLGLPPAADVGFVTGATMANFTGLAAGRQQLLSDAGWDLDRSGLAGAPRVRVIVAERHGTIDLSLRYLGLGAPSVVAVDEQGAIRLDALADALSETAGPAIVCLQAGNVHSVAFDPIRAATAHKTLNVPYDCGIAVVAHPRAVRDAMGMQASYLISAQGPGDPLDKVPELSRRARGVPVWAALRSLGRSGVADLVDRLAGHARALADGIAAIEDAEILNDVVFTQVCAAFGNDQRTRAVTARVLADGTVWMSGSRWRERDVLRISVSNWSTNADDVTASVAAVRRAATGAE